MFSTDENSQFHSWDNSDIVEAFGFMRYGNYNRSVVEEAAILGSDLVVIQMASEESRDDHQHLHEDEKSNPISDQDHHHEGGEDWLQLSIGGPRQDQTSRKAGSSLIELPLLMPSKSVDNGSNNISADHRSLMRPIGPSQELRAPRPAITNYAALFSQQLYPQDAANNWSFRPQVPTSIATSSSCSSSSSFTYPSSNSMAPSSYIPRLFQLNSGLDMTSQGSGIDFRVVRPPRRPHSGLWFMLKAMQNQEKEPYLPQISKMYLRIKDGEMTIRLVMKYLVHKLKLENESEIEIMCKGQKVLPFSTLQYVRDYMWSGTNSMDFITLPLNSSTIDHIMVLHYGRSAQTY